MTDDGYRIHVLDETDAVGVEDVLEFWRREDAMPEDEANRRVHEVLLVATAASGEVAGVSTIYLKRNAQLRMDLWYYRTFIAAEHRRATLARRMMLLATEIVEGRFVSGEDTRACAGGAEVQNEWLKRERNLAVGENSKAVFIGENDRGDHVYVRYYPGAMAPPPPARPTGAAPAAAAADDVRIHVFGETDAVTVEDVLAFWDREGAVQGVEANRRVHDVLLVATGADGGIVGVFSVYLAHVPRLRLPLWHQRVYVAASHRRKRTAWDLGLACFDVLERRFVAGEDTSGAGVIGASENPAVDAYLRDAELEGSVFIGNSDRGSIVRVRYFEGALAPPPPVGTGSGPR